MWKASKDSPKRQWTAQTIKELPKLEKPRLLSQAVEAYVLRVVVFHEGNYTQASRSLGISIRTLRNWLTEWGARKAVDEIRPTHNKTPNNERWARHHNHHKCKSCQNARHRQQDEEE